MDAFHLLFFTSLIVLTCPAASDGPTSHLVQLRDSVSFSYSGANLFLDLLRGNDSPKVVVEVFVNIMSSPDSRLSFRSIQPILSSYAGFATCLVIGILFAILMPLIGLVFCCARCCGKCGGRIQLMDSRKDPCKRVVYTICAVIIVTVQLMAVVLVFVNHFLLHEALVNRDPEVGVSSQLALSLNETQRALNDMFDLAVNTSSVNLDEHKAKFMKTIDDGLLEFQVAFIRRSSANHVSRPIKDLQAVLREFSPYSESERLLRSFNTSLSNLVQRLPDIRQQLTDALDSNCPYELLLKCNRLMHLAQTKLVVRYDVNQFRPTELGILLDNVGENLEFVERMSEFDNTLNGLAQVVKKAIEGELDDAWTDLARSSSTRDKLARSFEGYLSQANKFLDTAQERMTGEQDIRTNEGFIRSMEFRLYGLIALLCIPVLIFLLVYLGLCFGTCGHRPYEEAGVCNRGVGANLLLAGVGFIFLFSTVLMLFCTVLFLIGGPFQTEVCRYLTGRIPDGPHQFDNFIFESARFVIERVKRDHKLMQQLEEARRANDPTQSSRVESKVELGPLEVIMNLTRAHLAEVVLTRCRDESFVDAISGYQLSWPVLSEAVQSLLQGLLDSLDGVDLIAPLRRTTNLCANSLARLDFLDALNFTSAIIQTDSPITEIDNLNEFVSDLRSLNMAKLVPHIDNLVTHVVSLDNMRSQVRQLYVKLNNLPGQTRHLRSKLTEFNDTLANSVKQNVDVGLQKLRPILQEQLQLAVIATWRDIPCRPLHLAVKRGVDAVCVTILMPLNAFWAGLGLILLLFIPLIIFAVKLSSLYRKTEKYSPDYEEPDYISYHGFYMRPTSDYRVTPQKPRGKIRKHEGYSLISQDA
ncbi:unnamed protein product [Dicrocoelium dendriticum]|nr:unnamed protein product [Dicrocoelium dendriticum]